MRPIVVLGAAVLVVAATVVAVAQSGDVLTVETMTVVGPDGTVVEVC